MPGVCYCFAVTLVIFSFSCVVRPIKWSSQIALWWWMLRLRDEVALNNLEPTSLSADASLTVLAVNIVYQGFRIASPLF